MNNILNTYQFSLTFPFLLVHISIDQIHRRFVKEHILLTRLHHTNSLSSELFHKIKNIDFLLLLEPLDYDVNCNQSSSSTDAGTETY